MNLHSISLYVIGLAMAVAIAFKAKAIQAGVEWCWKKLLNRPQVTVEIREVCEDKILVSLQVDRYTVDLFIFLRVWVVNKGEVTTVPKDWTPTVKSAEQKLKAEGVPDISKWHQHSKVEKQQHGFRFIEDIREKLDAFGNQPLQHGIPAEGWLCFVARDVNDDLLRGATVSLSLIDSFGHKHTENKKEPWHCKGKMTNPERLW